jgi:beta-barrel assembly-enhancing protease
MESMQRISLGLMLVLLIGIFTGSCDKGTGLNLFTIQQDIEIGETMDSIIHADPVEYPILDPATHADAYTFMNQMMQRILQSDKFVHKTDFTYQITIIDKDVMNAFAVPGGKVYFYTGLMKYLDNAANLAGVMAHEMAHVDQRHSSQQLSKAYGVEFILNALLGDDKSDLVQFASDLAEGLASLKFSRSDEYEADEYSIKYMADTHYYHPLGIAGFFEKLKADGKNEANFEFLSTHPSDDNRLANMQSVWESLGSPTGEYFEEDYTDFKTTMLP